MKKLAFISLFVLFLAVVYFFPKPSKGQGLSFDKAYQDYQYNLTIYDNAYQDYVNAKNAYLQGDQTLPLKEDAREKTYTMLVARDQLMSVYLTAVRSKISELTGLGSDDKNNIFGKIDGEVNFYNNHKGSYHQGDSLDQLFATGSQSQSQWTNTTSLIVEEALFDISLGQVEGLRIDHESVYATLKGIINDRVSMGKLTLDPFNRWITDIDATDSTLKQNEGTAKTQIAQIYQVRSFQGGYNESINTLSSSIKPLLQFNQFLNEVLNYIKSHE